jgi:signal-transduction protein with cAMP-binding, CBS, and nucleotidyltransferase domain
MIIKSYLLNNPREKFLVTSQTDSVPIKKILATINNNLLGFCLIKIKKRYKILTDGDFRRSILKDNSFIYKKSNKIKIKKLIVIDDNSTMYEAYRLMVKKNINCVLVSAHKKIISYLTLHEIHETLSPERLNLDKKNLNKFKTDVDKHLTRYNFASLFIKKKILRFWMLLVVLVMAHHLLVKKQKM